ncbi:pyruvate kinase [Candidatus Berkiella aquae]|uniref:Pyruvate kinase n=1 Tax=Candidatus Berkiella aquae TaxID=295108 RepID=A0A0Q9Z115_9GAMM|nr:pyruvate kinase [Candidatus Berkiella aquae]MCS5712582.1 pyruvate kinase [Candidatus Berkiella aquae]
MPRRTKIITTLGPATDQYDKMYALIEAGANIMRINLSHGSHDEHRKRIELAMSCAKELNKTIGILLDLQGPKIRIAKFQNPEGILLKDGDTFFLDANCDKHAGNQTEVGLDYPELPQEVSAGDQLLLDDGRIVMSVVGVKGSRIECRVDNGGRLTNNKGLNRKGGGLSAPSLTEKDINDIDFIATQPVDYVALSFPREAADIHEARRLLRQAGSQAQIVAKIERAEAITNIDELIDAADALMVARGDLGVEIGFAELPGVQKHIINRARERDKPVITATQMMESMIHNSIPTRAEVSDAANAILDGTDAVMLSAETATGDYPVKVVSTLNEICLAAERHRAPRLMVPETNEKYDRHDKAIAMAAMTIASHVPIKAIVALTESGSTPLWMSRIRSGIPIYALSRDPSTCRRVTLYRGVYPVEFDLTLHKIWEISRQALALLVKQGILQEGDKVIVTKGDVLGVVGHTNALKILTAQAKLD